MATDLDIGPDGSPEIIDIERVSVITALDDPDPEKCQVSLQRVNNVNRTIEGNRAKRVILDLRGLTERNPRLRRTVWLEPR